MALPKVFEARFYRDLVLHPLRGGAGSNNLITSLLLAFSQLPNALGFFAEKLGDSRSRRRSSAGHDREEREP